MHKQKHLIIFLATTGVFTCHCATATANYPARIAGFFKTDKGIYNFDKMISTGIVLTAVVAALWLVSVFLLNKSRKQYGKALPLFAVILLTAVVAGLSGGLAAAVSYRNFRKEVKTAQASAREAREAAQAEEQRMEARKYKEERQKRRSREQAEEEAETRKKGIRRQFKSSNNTMSSGFSPDGSRLVVVGGGDTSLFSKDEKGLAEWTRGHNNVANVIDVATGKILFELAGHNSTPMDAAFSPDSQKIVTSALDGHVRVWDATTQSLKLDINAHKYGARCAAFTPNGAMVVSGGIDVDGAVRVWNAATGVKLREFDGFSSGVYALSCSPDGRQIAVGSDGVTILNLEAGARLRTLYAGEGRTLAASFSPDGKFLAAGGRDNYIRIWDTDNYNLIGTIPAHNGHVYTLAWLPDSRRLVSGGFDGKVRAWDTQTQKRLFEFSGHQDAVKTVSVSPDGHSAYSFAMTGLAYEWDLSKLTEEPPKQATVIARPIPLEVPWAHNLAMAVGEAKQSGKAVLVFFHDPNDSASRHTMNDVFKDPVTLAVVRDYFIPVRLEAQRNGEDYKRLGIEAGNQIRVYDAAGNPLATVDRCTTSAEIAALPQQARLVNVGR